MKKNTAIVVALLVGALIGVVGLYLILGETSSERSPEEVVEATAPAGEKKILYWQAPMDPAYIRFEPGKSPMGMDLIPVYAEDDGGETEAGLVRIDPVMIQTIGVRTAVVEQMELNREVRTIGRVDYDETRVYNVHTKVEGWIEKLYIDTTGQRVKKDDDLLEIYSPTLVSAQEEYLLSLKHRSKISEVGRESISKLSRRRLELWDVPEHQIMELQEKGIVKRTLHIHSPATGIIIDKPVTEGMFVKPGTKLYTIADISKVWVYVDIYEYELPWIKKGQLAEMTLASYPGRTFKGRIAFIYPFMEAKTRTNKVRLEFNNPRGELKPDMYANVTLKSVISKDAVVVLTEAVIMSGNKNIVIIDKGDGRFAPREVTIGAQGRGPTGRGLTDTHPTGRGLTDTHPTDRDTTGKEYYEVIEGLSVGEVVVTSAHFLIDSESRLKEAVSKMLDGRQGTASEETSRQGTASEETSRQGTYDMDGMDHSGMEMMESETPDDTGGDVMDAMDHSGMPGMNH